MKTKNPRVTPIEQAVHRKPAPAGTGILDLTHTLPDSDGLLKVWEVQLHGLISQRASIIHLIGRTLPAVVAKFRTLKNNQFQSLRRVRVFRHYAPLPVSEFSAKYMTGTAIAQLLRENGIYAPLFATVAKS